MTRDIERILDRWFEEGPTEVADRVITAALDLVETTDQRRVSHAPRRNRFMPNSVKLAIAAAVVVLVGGFTVLSLQPKSVPSVGGPPSAAPSASAARLSTPAAVAASASSQASGVALASASIRPSTTTAAPGTARAVAISEGVWSSCALTDAGGVMCWGSNDNGQLGDGTTTNSTSPVAVKGLPAGITAVSAGGTHACALTSAGGVKCWGDNAFGQLGDGSGRDSTTPVDVVGLTSGVKAIEAAYTQSCALMATGGVKCWGDNGDGQLGDGTTTQRTTPVDVGGLGGPISSLSVKGSHACVLMVSGNVECWGLNDSGQLGAGSTTNSSVPVAVHGLPAGVTAIAAGGNSTCALITGGSAMCWGANDQGQLGDGTTTNRSLPVKVAGLSGLAAIASGGFLHTCALTAGGGVKCWGYGISGQLGNGTSSPSSTTPVDVKGLASGVRAIATQGAQYSCALLLSGGIECWGANDVGQLGNGTTTQSALPVEVVGF